MYTCVCNLDLMFGRDLYLVTHCPCSNSQSKIQLEVEINSCTVLLRGKGGVGTGSHLFILKGTENAMVSAVWGCSKECFSNLC